VAFWQIASGWGLGGVVKGPTKRAAAKTLARKNAPAGARNPARTKAAILSAATAIFAEKGFGGARVDDIAARACINKRMLYHYFGDKEALYKAVLEAAYVGIRSAEADLRLADRDPEEAMRQLASFTWDYFLAHPEFISLLNTENLMQGKYVRASKRIIALHSPMIALLRDTLEQGVKAGKFRPDIDPVELYISIAALGFFYLSNRWTLSAIFKRDLARPPRLSQRGRHIVDVIMAYLRLTNEGVGQQAVR
jgi:AcrR family transcriptional regulator